MGQKVSRFARRGRRGRIAGGLASASLALGIACAPAWSQSAVDADADTLLRTASAYLGARKTFTFDYDVDHEIVDWQGQKLQYSASGKVAASRPDKLHVTRKGPYADLEATINGKAISLYGRGLNVFAQLESPGTTIDAGVEEFRMSTGLDAAGADLLMADPYAVLMENAEAGVVVGDAVVGGVAATHLAFRTPTVDWQIWLRKGDQPVPLKYVITTKWVTGAPQYSVRMTNWLVDGAIDQAVFDFVPPADAKKLDSITADLVGDVTLEEPE